MKLLIEHVEDMRLIHENVDGKRRRCIEGVVLQAGVKNRNGRIYPPPVLEREVNKYVREAVNHRRAWGELGHPDKPTINLERVSHRVTELRRDGNSYVGKAVICDTPFGKILEGLLDSGGSIGASSRGLGSLRDDAAMGAKIVCDDYRLMVGFDIVADPSAPEAWIQAIHEAADWVQDERGEWMQYRDAMRKMSMSQIRENAGSMFGSYVDSLASRCLMLEGKQYTQMLAENFNTTTERVAELFEHALRTARRRSSADVLLRLETLLTEDVKRRAH
jgi:hypothetical protein